MNKTLQPPVSSLNPVIRCAVYTLNPGAPGLARTDLRDLISHSRAITDAARFRVTLPCGAWPGATSGA